MLTVQLIVKSPFRIQILVPINQEDEEEKKTEMGQLLIHSMCKCIFISDRVAAGIDSSEGDNAR